MNPSARFRKDSEESQRDSPFTSRTHVPSRKPFSFVDTNEPFSHSYPTPTFAPEERCGRSTVVAFPHEPVSGRTGMENGPNWEEKNTKSRDLYEMVANLAYVVQQKLSEEQGTSTSCLEPHLHTGPLPGVRSRSTDDHFNEKAMLCASEHERTHGETNTGTSDLGNRARRGTQKSSVLQYDAQAPWTSSVHPPPMFSSTSPSESMRARTYDDGCMPTPKADQVFALSRDAHIQKLEMSYLEEKEKAQELELLSKSYLREIDRLRQLVVDLGGSWGTATGVASVTQPCGYDSNESPVGPTNAEQGVRSGGIVHAQLLDGSRQLAAHDRWSAEDDECELLECADDEGRRSHSARSVRQDEEGPLSARALCGHQHRGALSSLPPGMFSLTRPKSMTAPADRLVSSGAMDLTRFQDSIHRHESNDGSATSPNRRRSANQELGGGDGDGDGGGVCGTPTRYRSPRHRLLAQHYTQLDQPPLFNIASGSFRVGPGGFHPSPRAWTSSGSSPRALTINIPSRPTGNTSDRSLYEQRAPHTSGLFYSTQEDLARLLLPLSDLTHALECLRAELRTAHEQITTLESQLHAKTQQMLMKDRKEEVLRQRYQALLATLEDERSQHIEFKQRSTEVLEQRDQYLLTLKNRIKEGQLLQSSEAVFQAAERSTHQSSERDGVSLSAVPKGEEKVGKSDSSRLGKRTLPLSQSWNTIM